MKKMFILLGLVILFWGCTPSRIYITGYGEGAELYGRGHYREAIPQFRQFIKNNPDSILAPVAQYYLAESHQKIGDIQKAKVFYQELIRKYSGSTWAGYAQEALKTLEPSRYHKVKKGDTLKTISEKFYKDPAKWQLIYQTNKDIIEDPNILYPGQRLCIPQVKHQR